MGKSGAAVRLTEEELAWLRGLALEQAADAGLFATHTQRWFHAESPNTFELEDAYAGVHFLLTGASEGGEGPLSFVANPALGEPVGYDLGHGRARVLLPAVVAEVADAIESISARAVRQRLASDGLTALAPFSGRPLEDDDKEWLLAVLQGLMVFMRRAATDRAPVLITLL